MNYQYQAVNTADEEQPKPACKCVECKARPFEGHSPCKCVACRCIVLTRQFIDYYIIGLGFVVGALLGLVFFAWFSAHTFTGWNPTDLLSVHWIIGISVLTPILVLILICMCSVSYWRLTGTKPYVITETCMAFTMCYPFYILSVFTAMLCIMLLLMILLAFINYFCGGCVPYFN